LSKQASRLLDDLLPTSMPTSFRSLSHVISVGIRRPPSGISFNECDVLLADGFTTGSMGHIPLGRM
jgi:hypothetical protein